MKQYSSTFLIIILCLSLTVPALIAAFDRHTLHLQHHMTRWELQAFSLSGYSKLRMGIKCYIKSNVKYGQPGISICLLSADIGLSQMYWYQPIRSLICADIKTVF